MGVLRREPDDEEQDEEADDPDERLHREGMGRTANILPRGQVTARQGTPNIAPRGGEGWTRSTIARDLLGRGVLGMPSRNPGTAIPTGPS